MFKDSLALTFGKHNLKVGGSLLLLAKMEPANGGGNDTPAS